VQRLLVRVGLDRTYNTVDVRDELRFRRLVTAHSGAVANYLRRRLSPLPKYELDDLVEETMAVVWRRLRDVPEDSGELPWIIGVARNVLRNAQRSDRRRVFHQGKMRPSLPGPSAEDVGIAELAAHAAMQALPGPDREVLTLIFWDGLDIEGVALVLGISSNAASTRVSRAKRRFLELFQSVESPRTPDVASDMSHQREDTETITEGESHA
jgi:RNA polymerase sigma-70 factor (ECF subfamily)